MVQFVQQVNRRLLEQWVSRAQSVHPRLRWTDGRPSERTREERRIKKWSTSEGPNREVQMYYSVWLQLQLDVTEFTKEEGETTSLM